MVEFQAALYSGSNAYVEGLLRSIGVVPQKPRPLNPCRPVPYPVPKILSAMPIDSVVVPLPEPTGQLQEEEPIIQLPEEELCGEPEEVVLSPELEPPSLLPRQSCPKPSSLPPMPAPIMPPPLPPPPGIVDPILSLPPGRF